MKMRNMFAGAILLFILFINADLLSQEPIERAVILSGSYSNNEVRLSWNPDSTAEEYRIFYRTEDTGIWEALATVSENIYNFEIDSPLQKEFVVFKSDPDPFYEGVSLPAGSYEITVHDQFDKGLCCNFGNGYFQLIVNNVVIFNATDFGSSDQAIFQVPEGAEVGIKILPDLFGNHLTWEIKDPMGQSFNSFGPPGTALRRNPSMGYIKLSQRDTLDYNKETIIIAVTEELASETEFNTVFEKYIEQLENDFFDVHVISVHSNSAPPEVKTKIQEQYVTYPKSKYLLLLGNIPVPYSGDMFPDAHPENHKGAWPADTYYADLDGIWTDSEVNETSAYFDRNHNVPGDGKFDQSQIPSTLELSVGRVDLSDLDNFSESELELTIAYLEKVISWKSGQTSVNRRGLIDDNFGKAFGAPASNAFRNFGPLVGLENIEEKDFLTELSTSTYLWAYGCGSGTHHSAEGVATVEDYAAQQIQASFLMTFGSQFGDWDNENNFLRAALATGNVLSNAWVGNPHWHFHDMAVGNTIGEAAWRNMNSHFSEGPQLVHVSLLGDPTLNQYPIKQVENFQVFIDGPLLIFDWEDLPIAGDSVRYQIFGINENGDFNRLNTESISSDSWGINNNLPADYDFLIVPERLFDTPTGTFWQRGLGTKVLHEDVQIVGIEEILSDQISVFPNPCKDKLSIYSTLDLEEYQLINSIGKVVSRVKSTGRVTTMVTKELPAGIYWLVSGKLRKKVIIVIIKN